MKKICIAVFGLFIFSLYGAGSQTCNAAEQTEEVTAKSVYLSDLRPLPQSSGYIVDRDREMGLLRINGVNFQKGLSVDSPSELVYKLDGKYSTFKAVVGPGEAYAEYEGKLIFSVYGDGNKIYESKPLGVGEEERIDIKVTGVDELALRISDNGLHTRFVVWADALLE